MSPFGGFEMPIQYSDIIDEHNAVRHSCGVFDVSHMGEVAISGRDAGKLVNHLFTNDVSPMSVGGIEYGMMCYEDGGTVDDLLVYKMGDNYFLLVINASNTDKDWDWIQVNSEGYDVSIRNLSDFYGQLAVQGPDSERVMEEVLGIKCSHLQFYTSMYIGDNPDDPCSDGSIIISRTGYTGEDGFEIYADHEYIIRCWDMLIESGLCKPCGLGCRDTLRFEVGLPLYGDELSEEISPIMGGLGIFCKLEKEEFIGKEALISQKTNGVGQRIIGIELEGKAIARNGYSVLTKEGIKVGTVTTGYHSISLDKSVCMALVDVGYSKLGTPLDVQIRKKIFPGKVVKRKFYDKHYKKE